MKEYYKTDRIDNASPIPDAPGGVKRLKEMGFKLVVVTARPHHERERSLLWVDRNFPGRRNPSTLQRIVTLCYPPGIFETVICTGQSQESTFADGHELITKLTKADVRTQREHGTTNPSDPVTFRSARRSTRKSL